jgi:hypothetical protein
VGSSKFLLAETHALRSREEVPIAALAFVGVANLFFQVCAVKNI